MKSDVPQLPTASSPAKGGRTRRRWALFAWTVAVVVGYIVLTAWAIGQHSLLAWAAVPCFIVTVNLLWHVASKK